MEKRPEKLNVKVIRTFVWDGKSTTKGEKITVPYSLAVELETARKVEILQEPKKPAAAPAAAS
jgi:cytochrome c peroxidase